MYGRASGCMAVLYGCMDERMDVCLSERMYGCTVRMYG